VPHANNAECDRNIPEAKPDHQWPGTARTQSFLNKNCGRSPPGRSPPCWDENAVRLPCVSGQSASGAGERCCGHDYVNSGVIREKTGPPSSMRQWSTWFRRPTADRADRTLTVAGTAPQSGAPAVRGAPRSLNPLSQSTIACAPSGQVMPAKPENRRASPRPALRMSPKGGASLATFFRQLKRLATCRWTGPIKGIGASADKPARLLKTAFIGCSPPIDFD